MSRDSAVMRRRAFRSGEIRQRRSQLKRNLATGRLHIADLLADPPEWAEDMALEQILLALPRIRGERAGRTMVAARASNLTTLGSLTSRQREIILLHLQRRHPEVWALWRVMAGQKESAV